MSVGTATGLAITNPLVKYRALVATKAISPDPSQHRLALHLAKLYERLKDYEPELEYSHRLDKISRAINRQQPSRKNADDTSAAPPRQSAWRRWLSARERQDTLALTRKLTSHESALQMNSPKGLMLHGEVGTGKSMLIDLFADCLPNRKKRRSHFNTFMLETFAKLEALRAERSAAGTSRLPSHLAFAEDDYSLLWLAKDMIQTSPILFLDEFQMPDRVASKILTNLMTGFFQLGGVLIATSNRMPEELAKAAGLGTFEAPPQRSFGWQMGLGGRRSQGGGMYGGYNEFVAFLDVLKARCEVWETEGGKDWRRVESSSVAPVKEIDEQSLADSAVVLEELDIEVEIDEQEQAPQQTATVPKHYNVPGNPHDGRNPLDVALIAATNGESVDEITWTPATIKVYGRKVSVPRAYQGVCMWTFDELCKANFGPADYITLASTFHTMILTEVPVLNWLMKNEARRLITVLDALYECRCKLFVSAAAGPDDIFFPEEQKKKSEGEESDSVYSETLSEVYQDATAPFRPNILTQNPNYAEPELEPDYTHARLSGLLRADSLEDGTPNGMAKVVDRGAKGGSSSNPFGRSFGKTDQEFERKPVDPDEVRYTQRPDFQKTSAFTGEDERFAYKRAQSRLWEMCSQRWWARDEADWHRPLPKEIRRWESFGEEVVAPHYAVAGSAADTEIRMTGEVEDKSRDERSFKQYTLSPEMRDGQTPEARVPPKSQPEREPPKKIGWTHFWGTIKWPGGSGGLAGAWGQGPDGLKDRGSEKR
ncbi:AFG1-like ATPase [Fulvia fulva]|uniref:AFG1-like ATPase n=1 Tax=Passalora fulva TaxID=5499 RepID=A0A9Q8UVM4_PASFU|nr:AFG1-like ATPase [Fulvia fulva]KAK4610742.1 AFG1-like ATPase [Fulvia fulva]KAK4611113.1 AFG1-like ATPase [Fulvia fulva]UJO24144.1 AFG1-like ATPase [Fulvia fulva]WPV22200.1 AFG1-like ATPase [Fulvia fulva]WPV36953.1 AFG1-like ATPase [Fulvia fulva]